MHAKPFKMLATTSSDASHELWVLWARTAKGRQSRGDLIKCQADQRALRHMSLPTTSTAHQLLPGTDFFVGGHHHGAEDECPYRSGQKHSRKSAVASRRDTSIREKETEFWTVPKKHANRKGFALWDINEILGESAHSHSSDSSTSFIFPDSTAAAVKSSNSSDAVGDDVLSHMTNLRIASSIVKQQEEIWEQIKKNPTTTQVDVKASTVSRLLQDTRSASWHDKKTRNCSGAKDSTLKLQGKQVRIISQAQVEEAWKRGEAIEIMCVVCKMQLLTTVDMYPGMVYCPECGAIASSDLYKKRVPN